MTVSTPVIFIHGLWLHSSSWKTWIDVFGAEGFDPSAPGWPREHSSVFKCRQRGEDVVGMGTAAIADHYARLIASLEEKPVVIGHSTGGLIAESLLARDLVSAAVAIDPARAKGELPQPLAQLVDEFPPLGSEANRGREVNLNNRQFRKIFGNTISEDESDALYERWTIPASGRLLLEADFADSDLNTPSGAAPGPLLFVTGKGDLGTEATSESSFQKYRHPDATTDTTQFADRGHSLVIDHDWPDVAKSILGWVREHAG